MFSRKRVLVLLLVLAISATMLWAGGKQEVQDSGSDGDRTITLTMWGWDPGIAEKISIPVAKAFPNVELEMVAVDSASAFTQKIRTSAAAGIDLPDLPWFERGQRGSLYSLDLWENLEESPYNLDTDLVFDYAIPTVQNFDGEVIALPWDIALGGLAYKRDLARKYFGTDDPKKLEAMFSDWEAFIAAGKKVNRESGGSVYMFAAGEDAYRIIDGQNPVPIVDSGVADLTGVVKPGLDLVLRMRRAGLIDDHNEWSPGWNAAIGGSEHIFFPCPVWFPQYIIEPNDPDGKGNWGLMVPPGGGFNWGGTAIGIAKDSDNKETAWDFLQWFLLSEEGARVNKENIGFFTHYKPAYEDPEFASLTSVMFGDQNIGEKWFKDIAPETEIRPVSPYDGVITDVSQAVFSVMGDNPDITIDELMETYKSELLQQAPDLTVK